MLNNQKYVVLSLEQHLFFGRIMKEHAFFLEAGFTPKNNKLSKEADNFKIQFEKLLLEAVKLSNGIIREDVLDSGELFTEYTLSTEKKSQYFTGIELNKKITLMEKNLNSGNCEDIKSNLVKVVKQLNKKAVNLLDGIIDFKTRVLNGMLSCELFTMNYPLLVEHIRREAKLYRSNIINLENGQDIEEKDIRKTELFWDQIMMEHAMFIRGLLDPSEDELIEISDKFAKEYAALLEKTLAMTDETIASVTEENLDETIRINEFKQAGTKGIDDCKIKAIFLPLLADHVLRESNHYIRLLKSYKK